MDRGDEGDFRSTEKSLNMDKGDGGDCRSTEKILTTEYTEKENE